MFGYYLLSEDEQNCASGRGSNILSYLDFYNEGEREIVVTLTEKFNKEHNLIDEYVGASVRATEEEWIKQILEMIPFWKFREYAIKEKKDFLSRHCEDLRRFGVPDNEVNELQSIILAAK